MTCFFFSRKLYLQIFLFIYNLNYDMIANIFAELNFTDELHNIVILPGKLFTFSLLDDKITVFTLFHRSNSILIELRLQSGLYSLITNKKTMN